MWGVARAKPGGLRMKKQDRLAKNRTSGAHEAKCGGPQGCSLTSHVLPRTHQQVPSLLPLKYLPNPLSLSFFITSTPGTTTELTFAVTCP